MDSELQIAEKSAKDQTINNEAREAISRTQFKTENSDMNARGLMAREDEFRRPLQGIGLPRHTPHEYFTRSKGLNERRIGDSNETESEEESTSNFRPRRETGNDLQNQLRTGFEGIHVSHGIGDLQHGFGVLNYGIGNLDQGIGNLRSGIGNLDRNIDNMTRVLTSRGDRGTLGRFFNFWPSCNHFFT